MKKVFLEKSLNLIKNYYSYDDIKLQEIKYGLETLYITITKTVVIFALALLLNIFKELMIMMVFYGFLRLFAHGLHAKKSWQCWVTSVPLFLILPYLSTILFIPKEIYLILGTFITIMIYFYAPADTEKKPIVNKKRRMFFKITSTVISIMYLVLIFSSCLTTGFGFYDKLGRFGGTGTIIPITGFANSMTSAGIESKPEGLCLGIFMNLFKLAGSVISSSIVFGVLVGLISWVINKLWKESVIAV